MTCAHSYNFRITRINWHYVRHKIVNLAKYRSRSAGGAVACGCLNLFNFANLGCVLSPTE